jgi:hypothetical protein
VSIHGFTFGWPTLSNKRPTSRQLKVPYRRCEVFQGGLCGNRQTESLCNLSCVRRCTLRAQGMSLGWWRKSEQSTHEKVNGQWLTPVSFLITWTWQHAHAHKYINTYARAPTHTHTHTHTHTQVHQSHRHVLLQYLQYPSIIFLTFSQHVFLANTCRAVANSEGAVFYFFQHYLRPVINFSLYCSRLPRPCILQAVACREPPLPVFYQYFITSHLDSTTYTTVTVQSVLYALRSCTCCMEIFLRFVSSIINQLINQSILYSRLILSRVIVVR